MAIYTFKDFIFGETLDPDQPAHAGLGENVAKGTILEYLQFVSKLSNQARRFGRQLQLKESRQDES